MVSYADHFAAATTAHDGHLKKVIRRATCLIEVRRFLFGLYFLLLWDFQS